MNKYHQRWIHILFFFVIVVIIYIVRLLNIQVVDESYAAYAQQLDYQKTRIHAPRGLMTDRNSEMLVYNEKIFDLVINYNSNSAFDTTKLAKILGLDIHQTDSLLLNAYNKRYRGQSVFFRGLNPIQYGKIVEVLHDFSRFSIQDRYKRNYKNNIAAHLLGYLGEVSANELKTLDRKLYYPADYVGKNGLEKVYEKALRGTDGFTFGLKDATGRTIKNNRVEFEDIKYKAGKDLKLTIDTELQKFGEGLLQGKKGSIVALEPNSGEILAMVSSPGFKPDMLSIDNLKHYYPILALSQQKPLINRAVGSWYPPGSIFKPLMALIGLEEGVIYPETTYPCNGGYRLGNHLIRCHPHYGLPDLQYSIQTSCNAYYCYEFKALLNNPKYKNTEEAYKAWYNHLVSFGLGNRLGIDLYGESAGVLKDSEYFNKKHGKDNWNYARIISMSIGQGELGITPLQMANYCASIANRGFYYTPHLVKSIGDQAKQEQFLKKHAINIKKEHFETVIGGMRRVMLAGTGAGANISGYEICGKTGTVQNPHGENHSVFIAFAPQNNPKIAIAVIVENAGYGASYAAPITTLMIENYLRPDSITESKKQYLITRMKNARFISHDLDSALNNVQNRLLETY